MKSIFTYWAVIFILLFSSCQESMIYDAPAFPADGFLEYNLPGYMTLKLHSGYSSIDTRLRSEAGTETPEFHPGEIDEYSIAPGNFHFVILYSISANSTPAAILSLSSDIYNTPATPDDNREDTEDDNLLSIKSIYSNYDTGFGEKEQTDLNALKKFLEDKECYILINSPYSVTDLQNLKKSDLLNNTVGEYSIFLDSSGNVSSNRSGTEYFTMSNSTFIYEGIRTSAEIISENIFDTKQMAVSNPAIIGYVERLAAKYTISFADIINDITTGYIPGDGKLSIYDDIDINGTSYSIKSKETGWSIRVLGYGINGLEKSSRLFKRLSLSGYGNDWNWNDPENHRSYWGEDSNYEINAETKLKYPHQYRHAFNTDTVRSFHDNSYTTNPEMAINNDNPNYCLKYISFQDIAGENCNGNYPERIFSHENTYHDPGIIPSGWLWKRGYFSAGSHLVVACQILLDGFGNNADLFRDKDNIFYIGKEELIHSKIDIFTSCFISSGKSEIHIPIVNWDGGSSSSTSRSVGSEMLGWNDGTVLWVHDIATDEIRKATPDDFTLIPACISGGDGQVMLAPAYSDAVKKYYIAPTKEDNTTYDKSNSKPISYNELTSLLYITLGSFDHFFNGYMYYAAPITHKVEMPAEDGNSWKNVGDIGVVRNNWYKLNIYELTNIGSPVDIPAQPIIPTLETIHDYLGITVNVLPWHKFTQTDIPIFP